MTFMVNQLVCLKEASDSLHGHYINFLEKIYSTDFFILCIRFRFPEVIVKLFEKLFEVVRFFLIFIYNIQISLKYIL
jgi:hypothetical protein